LKEIDDKIKLQNDDELVQRKLRDKMVGSVGNLVHDSVPIDNDEKNNKIERTWGKPRDLKVDGTKGKAHHH